MSRSFICEHCHQEFVDRHRLQTRRFCSRECERAFRRANATRKKCKQCGKTYSPVHPKTQKYCSKECEWVGKRKPGANGNKYLCENCGEEFIDFGWARSRKYCSIQCTADATKIRVAVTCLNCGKVSDRQRGWAKQANVHFCNRECRNTYQSGPTHPKWRGGAARWYGTNWLRQSAAARKRDGYCCRRCGVSQESLGVTLDVHHMIPFREFGIERYKEANHLSNLVSLCRNCHAKVEWGHDSLQLKLL